MPIYFTGQTAPALPVNSLQYNSGPGQFAGDANLTWVPATGLAVGRPVDVQYTVSTNVSSELIALNSTLFVNGSASGSANLIGANSKIRTTDANANNFGAGNSLIADYVAAYHGGSGSVNKLFGTYHDTENFGGGTVNQLISLYPYIFADAASHVNSGYGTWVWMGDIVGGANVFDNLYAYSFTPPGAGTATVAYVYHSDAVGGVATNTYPLWFDEQGVFRIRSENTFNSVYQAIPALYNPQFTKYTPGAANHERIVLGQWSSDVAQIGTEKGGTGTLRAMDFIGASVGFPLSATNGQNFAIKILTELTTIAAAATTDTAIQIPANAVVFGVDVRVTVVIPTAATFTVIGAGSSTVFNTAAVTVAANSTDKGTKSCPFYNATAQAIRITPDVQPGANSGRVRVTIHYYEVTAATS